MAEAMQWVSRITTVALMMLVPILGGRKLDEMRGTGYWSSIGLIVGLLLGAWQLRQIVVDSNRAAARSGKPRSAADSKREPKPGESDDPDPKQRP
jgi:F0F1-type ATP synthase assembly protein I